MATRTNKPRPKLTPEQLPGQITKSLLAQVRRVARDCRADAVVIGLDALEGELPKLPEDFEPKVLFITNSTEEPSEKLERRQAIIRTPQVDLGRAAQVKMGVLLALSRGKLKKNDVVVAVSGSPRSGALDQLSVLSLVEEYSAFHAADTGDEETEPILPPVLERIVNLAVQLGSEGREGRAVGALFVIGDSERVGSLSKQLILNPFQGYEEEQRNVLDPKLEETVKELSTIDGAFVVRGDGVIESAGTLLRTGPEEEVDLPKGLGARHAAAATITSLSQAVAIAVSASTGTVSVFRNGRIVTEIEKPRGRRAK